MADNLTDDVTAAEVLAACRAFDAWAADDQTGDEVHDVLHWVDGALGFRLAMLAALRAARETRKEQNR